MTNPEPTNPSRPEPVSGANDLCLAAHVVECSPLRHTPAGVPLASVRLAHESRRIEAGAMRDVNVELAALAIGELAPVLAAARPGARVTVRGFLAAKSARSRMPVLHVNNIEFMEGN